MVSVKEIAAGLSKQIADAIAGKADAVQADVLCKSVDTLIKLARLQIEMGGINWSESGQLPVLQMEAEPAQAAIPGAVSLPVAVVMGEPTGPRYTVATMTDAEDDDLRAEIKRMEIELAHAERDAARAADGDGNFAKCDRQCKTLRKYLLSLRDELAER